MEERNLEAKASSSFEILSSSEEDEFMKISMSSSSLSISLLENMNSSLFLDSVILNEQNTETSARSISRISSINLDNSNFAFNQQTDQLPKSNICHFQTLPYKNVSENSPDDFSTSFAGDTGDCFSTSPETSIMGFEVIEDANQDQPTEEMDNSVIKNHFSKSQLDTWNEDSIVKPSTKLIKETPCSSDDPITLACESRISSVSLDKTKSAYNRPIESLQKSEICQFQWKQVPGNPLDDCLISFTENNEILLTKTACSATSPEINTMRFELTEDSNQNQPVEEMVSSDKNKRFSKSQLDTKNEDSIINPSAKLIKETDSLPKSNICHFQTLPRKNASGKSPGDFSTSFTGDTELISTKRDCFVNSPETNTMGFEVIEHENQDKTTDETVSSGKKCFSKSQMDTKNEDSLINCSTKLIDETPCSSDNPITLEPESRISSVRLNKSKSGFIQSRNKSKVCNLQSLVCKQVSRKPPDDSCTLHTGDNRITSMKNDRFAIRPETNTVEFKVFEDANRDQPIKIMANLAKNKCFRNSQLDNEDSKTNPATKLISEQFHSSSYPPITSESEITVNKHLLVGNSRNEDVQPDPERNNCKKTFCGVVEQGIKMYRQLRENEHLQDFVTRAKSSYHSFLNTFVLEMNLMMGMTGPLNILVIATTEDAVTIKESFHKSLRGRVIIPNCTEETMPVLPVGYESALKVVQSKVKQAREQNNYDPSMIMVSSTNFITEVYPQRWQMSTILYLDDPNLDLILHNCSTTIPVPNEYIEQVKRLTPEDYPLKDLGLACTLEKAIAATTNMEVKDVQKTLCGVTYAATLKMAADVLAGMYNKYATRYVL